MTIKESSPSADKPGTNVEDRPATILGWIKKNRYAPVKFINMVLTWFTGDRHADYGLAVMRMASGFLVFGWLVLNIPVAARVWGPGSAYWDGYREVLGYQWPLNLLRHAGTGPFWLWYVAAIVLSVAFMVGWRTRITTPLLFVFYAGINAQNVAIADGGNYFFRIMLMYLIFADVSRRWSLDARRRARRNSRETETGTVLHNLALCLVVAQLCMVYLEAGLYKVQGALWQNGTAMYYPLESDFYGVFPFFSDLATNFTWMVVLVTYFSVLIQIAFTFMLFNKITRRIALLGILSMHLGIAVLMGLPFFSGIMASADAVLVSGTTWVLIVAWLGRCSRSALAKLPIGRFKKLATPAPVPSVENDDVPPSDATVSEGKKERENAGV
jgi:hypothetical protein